MASWTDLWSDCTDRLGDGDAARRLVEYASGRSGASWLVILTSTAPDGAHERMERLTQRRLAGEPLQYIVGRWGFRELEVRVDKRVLIPRPETEQVAGAAIDIAKPLAAPLVADLGTGSGAIAFSIAKEVRHAQVWATDESADALAVAELNWSELPYEIASRVTLLPGSWFEALPDELRGALDVIVSNPPYVAERDRDSIDSEVKDWEPNGALFAGEDGLDDIRIIAEHAAEWLKPAGSLVIELAPTQAVEVSELLSQNGFAEVSIGRDYSQRQRWVVAKKRP